MVSGEQSAERQCQDFDLRAFAQLMPLLVVAADLLIWDRLTPHGSSINTSPDPRMVLFLNCTPTDEASEATDQAATWRAQWGGIEGGPRVSELGKRLAGLQPW